MKDWLDVLKKEWGCARNALLDAYVEKTGRTYFSDGFIVEMGEKYDVNLYLKEPVGVYHRILFEKNQIYKMVDFVKSRDVDKMPGDYVFSCDCCGKDVMIMTSDPSMIFTVICEECSDDGDVYYE